MDTQRKPSLYIGKQPFYIGYVGVDRDTHEVKTPVTEKPDMKNVVDRTDRFAKSFGYQRKGHAV